MVEQSAVSSWQTYKRLLTSTRSYMNFFVLGMVATLLVSLIDAGLTWLLKPIMNEGLINRNMHFLKWLPLIILLTFVFRGLSTFVSTYCINLMSRNIVRDFRCKLFNKYLFLPTSYYDANSSGGMLSAIIYNVEQVASATSDSLLMLMRESTYLVGLVVVMLLVSWKLSLFFFIVVPLIAYVIKWSSTRMRYLSIGVQELMGEVTRVADEGIQATQVIKLYEGQQREATRFNKVAHQNRNREMKVIITNCLSSGLVQVLLGIPLAGMLYFATLPSLHISPGGFTSIIAAMISIIRPFRRLTGVSKAIQKGVAGAESIFTILDEEEEKDHGQHALTRVQGAIEYRAVGFNYKNTTKAALSDITFSVKPGSQVAIVGHSGGGKTTLVNLLPRFYDVSSGEILLDGRDIFDYSLSDLRRQFSYVSQNIVLFDDTVANNIAYGCGGDVTRDEIEHAAKAAAAFDFISSLAQGFDSVIGESGVLLSGGQRQRIAIARAIIKRSPILILDEATSSLDTQSERAIQEALDRLIKDRTTLVIAHRLSTIENSDHIIVVDQGRLVEQGRHEQLLQLQGLYSKLHRIQFKTTETPA